MGERLLCKQEVVGSIPSGSTRSAIDRARRRLDVACARTGLAHDWARVNSAGRKRSARALDGPFCSSRSLKRFARVRVRPSVRVLFDIVKRRSLRARLDENRGRFAFSMYGFAGPPHRKMPRVADCATCRRRLTARAVGTISKQAGLSNQCPIDADVLETSCFRARCYRDVTSIAAPSGWALIMRTIKCLKGIRWMPWR